MVKQCFDSKDYVEGRQGLHGKAQAGVHGDLTRISLGRDPWQHGTRAILYRVDTNIDAIARLDRAIRKRRPRVPGLPGRPGNDIDRPVTEKCSDGTGLGRIAESDQALRRGDRGRRCFAADRPRAVDVPARPIRLRQDDDAAPDRGLRGAAAGEIAVGDRVVSSPVRTLPPGARNMSMIFQSYALWPHMTVAENVAYGLTLRNPPPPISRRSRGRCPWPPRSCRVRSSG